MAISPLSPILKVCVLKLSHFLGSHNQLESTEGSYRTYDVCFGLVEFWKVRTYSFQLRFASRTNGIYQLIRTMNLQTVLG